MNKFIKHIILLLGCLSCFSIEAQQDLIIQYNHTESTFLRWGVHKTADGYNIYRRENNGNWDQLNSSPITYILNNQVLVDQFGHNSQLLIGLLGKPDNLSNLTINDFKSTWQNDKKFNLINAMALVNPHLGKSLGVWFEDKTVVENSIYQYQIKAIVNGAETVWATSSPRIKNGKQAIPYVDKLNGEGKNTSAHLFWNKNIDAYDLGDIVTYNLYKSESDIGNFYRVNVNGIFPMTVNFSGDGAKQDPYVQEYLDEYLQNEKPYYYYVTAVNAFGFESQPSATIEVIPGNYLEPLPPYEIKVERLGNAANITWTNNEESINGYEIYRSTDKVGNWLKIYPPNDNLLSQNKSFLDQNIKVGQSYYYAIKTVNTAGVSSEFGTTEVFQIEDIIPPSPPTNITGSSEKGTIQLNWAVPNDNDIEGYQIQRTGGFNQMNRMYDLFGADMVITNTYTDSNFGENNQGSYGYIIFSIDQSGNISEPSDTFIIRLADNNPPPVPSIIRFNEDESKQEFTLTWSTSTAKDIDKYVVHYSNDGANYTKLSDSKSNQYNYNHNGEIGQHFFAISAIDIDGNESEKSAPHSATLKPSVYPDSPINGTIVFENNSVKLNWSPPQNANIVGYHIAKYANGGSNRANVGEVDKSILEFLDPHIIKGDEYVYEIRSYDKDWNMSKPLTLKIKIR